MNCNQHGNSEVLTDNGNIPLALSKDELINENSSVWYNSYSSTVIMSNNWKGKTDKYLGLRIKKNGQLYYGWAKLTIPLDESYVIVQEYAYQDSPGVGLKAGEIEASQPEFTLSTTTLVFGEVTINTSSEKTVTVSNTGTSVVTINRLQLSGKDEDYSVNQGLGGFTLNPSETKEFSVKFKPLTEGSKFAQLTFVDTQGNHVSVDLTGTGINPESGELSLSFLSCNFGETANDGKKDTTIILYNTGSGILTIDSIYYSGNEKEHFCHNEIIFPVNINPDSHTNIQVSFAPKSYGAKQANLIIAYNSGMTTTIALSGTSVVSSVENESKEFGIKIYPNPASDNLIISLPETTANINCFNIYNQKGINVNDRVDFTFHGYESLINIRHLPAGLYLINYQDGKILLQERFIIIN